MTATITQVVKQFQQEWTTQLEPAAILAACHGIDYTWRVRLLNPVLTIQLFFVQVLNGNTACTHLRHLTKVAVSASAYCQARAKLPLTVFKRLLQTVSDRLQSDLLAEGQWLGHRTFLVDGSSFSMPDTPELQDHFGQPGGQRPGCGCPVAHFLALLHAGTGMLVQVLSAPLRTHDLSQVVELHPALRPGDVLVGDRGFCSYVHLALLILQGVHGVLRMHQKQIVDFTPARPHVPVGQGNRRGYKGQPRSRWLKQLGPYDQIVDWMKPTECPEWMSEPQFASLPGFITVREVRYRVQRPGFRVTAVTLVTTLLDAETYTVDALASLYFARWGIETNLGHLKTTMGLDVLKCKTGDGVLKELIVFALIYNLVPLVMWEAAKRQRVDVERMSFIDAARWLASARDDEPRPALVVNPHRPYRYEPRVRKRRPKPYPLMTKPRQTLRKSLVNGT
jgi:Transposase DDE domain